MEFEPLRHCRVKSGNGQFSFTPSSSSVYSMLETFVNWNKCRDLSASLGGGGKIEAFCNVKLFILTTIHKRFLRTCCLLFQDKVWGRRLFENLVHTSKYHTTRRHTPDNLTLNSNFFYKRYLYAGAGVAQSVWLATFWKVRGSNLSRGRICLSSP